MLARTSLALSDGVQKPHLVLVHIPVGLFPFFIQPLFRILFGADHDDNNCEIAWIDRHEFLNFSITPVGCSLMCSKALVDKCLAPLVKQFNALAGRIKGNAAGVEISQDEYLAIQVDGQGLDAGQRVLELTGPLAMAGM